MKRDHDYIRELLLEAENSINPYISASMVIGRNDKVSKRYFHANLLKDAGFFAEVGKGTFRLTNQGCDYLDVIRNDTVWQKTKDVAKKTGGTTLGIMKDIALSYVKQKIAGALAHVSLS